MGHDHPFLIARRAAFVAYPAGVRAVVVEDAGVRLVFANQFDVAVKIVHLLFAVRPLATGIVKPHAEDVAVAGEQLGKLVFVVVVVRVGAVIPAVAIPRGQVEAEADAAAPAGLRRLAHHVAPAVFVGAVFHAMLGVPALPQAEAVVMLGRQDHARHARGLDGLDPLVAVQLRGVEDRGILISQTPLAPGVRVRAEVNERVEGIFQKFRLPRRGLHARRRLQKRRIIHGWFLLKHFLFSL